MGNYKPTIGLEIHSELRTSTKMFCGSKNDPEEKHPNINICPVCTAHPGTLPVINIEAVKKVILVGLALRGDIPEYSQFDRKNYYYPDLPKGYQISQYKHPLVSGGNLVISGGKKVRVTRVHLEEDTGSLTHDKSGNTFVDFNRAGIPLLELVTEPDVESALEAVEFAREIQLIFQYVGASYARMERGEMRVEANISVSKDSKLGTKVEIKNLNSFKAVERAIAYEIRRQKEVLESGAEVEQETRGWDDKRQKTVSQRLKEEAHDYRYFPEPDLPPLKMNVKGGINTEDIKLMLPELPQAKKERLIREYGFDRDGADILVSDREMSAFFESSHSEMCEWLSSDGYKDKSDRAVSLLRNYLLSDLSGLVNEKSIKWSELLVSPENFAELVKLIISGEISSRGAKDILLILVESGGDPSDIAREKGFLQTNDAGIIEATIVMVKENNTDAFKDYIEGNDKVLQFLIGQTMKELKNKGKSANPGSIKEYWKKERTT